MIWDAKPKPEWRTCFPLFRPIALDCGRKILWERVARKLHVTKEWAGMGADGWEGFWEYRDANGNYLGQVTVKN